jgi:hypothetical protein
MKKHTMSCNLMTGPASAESRSSGFSSNLPRRVLYLLFRIAAIFLIRTLLWILLQYYWPNKQVSTSPVALVSMQVLVEGEALIPYIGI